MYGKVFDSIYDGTLYGHWEAIVTMQQLIVLATPDGVIDMTPQAIAARTSIPFDIIEKGLKLLGDPDPYTRTPGDEGRRIVLLDDHRPWGWRLVNHGKYMRLRDMDQKREADRSRISEKRKKNKGVASESQNVANVAHLDSDLHKDLKTKPPAPLALPDWLDIKTWNEWVSTRPSKARKEASLKAALAKLETFRGQGHDGNAIIAESLANGWQGLFAPKEQRLQAVPAGNRPSITCSDCQQKVFTWTSGRCDPCWRKSQGLAA